MARIRSVHPGLFTDDAFMGLSAHAQIFLIGLWTECDDQGVFQWRPNTLKARLLPAHHVDVQALLTELASALFIKSFEVRGVKFGAVRNFSKFQRPKAPKAVFPLPAQFRNYVNPPAASSETTEDEVPPFPPTEETEPNEPEPVPPKEEKSPQMEDGGGSREEEEDSRLILAERPGSEPERPRPKPNEDFEAFWREYPSRGPHTDPKKPARAKFEAAIAKGADPETIIRGAKNYALAVAAAGTEPKYVCQALTWLNQERWNDHQKTVDTPPKRAVYTPMHPGAGG